MKLLNKYIKTHIPLLSLILSIVVAWIIFPIVTGFPIMAFAILFVGVSSLMYVLKKDKVWTDSILYIGVLLLSFFTIYRANDFLRFFDFIFIIFFISILLRPLSFTKDILHLLLSPITVFFNTLTSNNIFKYTFTPHAFLKRKNNIKEYTTSIIVTAIVMLATIPLLASANPLFNNLLKQLFELLHLDGLWKFFLTDSIAIYLLRIFALLILTYMIPRVLTVMEKSVKEYVTIPEFSINYLIPKIALAGTLVVFFITQMQLYFASAELLKSLGYTNAQLTQEVFAQVTLVAFIVLLLTYLDKSRKKWNSRLTYFLLLEAFFLIGIAFKSVYDYSAIYGYTQKRLWGYASMSWLAGALFAYVYHFYKKTSVQEFIKQMLSFSVIIIVIINLLNFDRIIYTTAKPSPGGEVDYKYLSQRSADAYYYNELLPRLIKDIKKSKVPDKSKIQAAQNILRSINRLRNKYGQNGYLNSFNITEYQEYQATRGINVEPYRKIIIDNQKY